MPRPCLSKPSTKRFPELDREIAANKAQLEERSYEIQDLANKLARQERRANAAERTAAFHQEELLRVQEVLGKKRRGTKRPEGFRRASQWAFDDYRSEYDRLNLEMSKLRQQLAQLQDRDVQQAGYQRKSFRSLPS